jgi:hypothetical protein
MDGGANDVWVFSEEQRPIEAEGEEEAALRPLDQEEDAEGD